MAHNNCIVAGKYLTRSSVREPIVAVFKWTTASTDTHPPPATVEDPGALLDQSKTNPIENATSGVLRIHLNVDCYRIYPLGLWIVAPDATDQLEVEAIDLTAGSNHIDLNMNDGGSVAHIASKVCYASFLLIPSAS